MSSSRQLLPGVLLALLLGGLLPIPFAAQQPGAQPAATLPRLETGSVRPMPPEWIDAATGHRVVRLTRGGGASRSFYFHNDPFLPGRNGAADRMVYYGDTPQGPQLFVLDLRTLASEQLTRRTGRITGEIVGAGRREVFYQVRDTVFATHLDTRATRLVAVLPPGYDGAIASLNADGTLLAGVRSVPEKRAVIEANPGRSFDAIFAAKLPHTLFTIAVATGQLQEVYQERAWLNHVQFSPTDPNLLMFCHEGPWHLLDRIWTLDLGTGEVTKRHERTVDREIAGHEFWSRDGRTIWYDLQVPRGETFFLAGVDVETGQRTAYALTSDEWSIHYNIAPDQALFAGDGGDSSQVAGAKHGRWLYLFRPAQPPGRLVSEPLVDMRRHDYTLEPNVHFSPDGKWVIFRANLEGESQVYAVAVEREQPGALDWPAIGAAQRPWTRWWWPGSAVTDQGLTAALEAYQAAGLGGVEVTPIYGVAGYERQFIDYLSPEWVARLEHTLREAGRLGLGVDMATGTGWPFGGPTVGDVTAAKYLALDTFRVPGGQRLNRSIAKLQPPLVRAIGNRLQLAVDSGTPSLQRAGRGRITIEQLTDPIAATPDLQALAIEQVRFPRPMPLVALLAQPAAGAQQILTRAVRSDGTLDWTAPPGDWTLSAFHQGWHGKMVERAAPGGEGLVLDHFSAPALRAYLARFDSAFAGRDLRGLRAFFNDSYEVDDALGEANWTPAMFDEFRARRGYDLTPHLPELFGHGDSATCARVLSDYRETISDLLLERFTGTWRTWAHERSAVVRNQAHGSPANILDLYAASDIPETEGNDILRFKSATSAAHVTGKSLVSAEAATWLGEHFLSSLADVKQAVDRYFLGGVNHIVYHGTAYSPVAAPWPGWLFYAAVHFQPTNPQWADFRALNEYVARAQSILQGGRPDNDILLYLPVHDRWAVRSSSLLAQFDGSMTPFAGMTVADDAALLQRRGYAFDFISDRQLQGTTAANGQVRTGGTSYRVVVVPGVELMPHETMAQLLALARGGATVIFHRRLPADVPGLHDLAARRAALPRALAQLEPRPGGAARVQHIALGSGAILLGDNLQALLAVAGVRREPLVDAGLEFVRRRSERGTDYLIVNGTDRVIDDWFTLTSSDPGAALFDPMTGETGVAKFLPWSRLEVTRRVHLHLDPGGSIIVRTWREPFPGQPFREWRTAGARPLTGTWQLRFISGGPELPAAVQLPALVSWTKLGTEAGRAFSGTASYTLEFDRPDWNVWNWLLDLGDVRESARVRLNGQDLGTLIGPTYRVAFTAALFRDRNVLEVTVSNLMANRIAALDRQQVPWKRFYNVNFPPNRRENAGADGLFDASRWEPRASGLLGPVTLTALAVY